MSLTIMRNDYFMNRPPEGKYIAVFWTSMDYRWISIDDLLVSEDYHGPPHRLSMRICGYPQALRGCPWLMSGHIQIIYGMQIRHIFVHCHGNYIEVEKLQLDY